MAVSASYMQAAPDLTFLEFAKTRHQIYLDRERGEEWPWTQNPILFTYSFTNVYRELDKTTVWFRENIRDKIRDQNKVLFATAVFRWFNTISVGDTLKDLLLEGPDVWVRDEVYEKLKYISPITTGAYIIRSPVGMDKLTGVLHAIDHFHKMYMMYENGMVFAKEQQSMEMGYNIILPVPLIGPFMSYEIICDLRYTHYFENALDQSTWGNAGPGAQRGLARVNGSWPSVDKNETKCLAGMRELLEEIQMQWPEDWPRLEMREIEHTLCEYDKYQRVRNGEGAPRQKYRKK